MIIISIIILLNNIQSQIVEIDETNFNFTGLAFQKYFFSNNNIKIYLCTLSYWSSDFYSFIGENYTLYWNFRSNVDCKSILYCSGSYVAVVKKESYTLGLGTYSSENVSLLPNNMGVKFLCLFPFFFWLKFICFLKTIL